MAAAAVQQPTTASSTASGAQLPDANPTSTVARTHITEILPSSGKALTGNASADYDFQKNLEAAESCFLEGKDVEAQKMFLEIKDRIEKAKLPKTSLLPLRCFLGLIYSSPVENKPRYFADFITTLTKVYASRKDWPSSAYSELRWLLNKFRPLIPKNQSLSLVTAKVDGMIAECAKHILPIDAFNEMVKEANEEFKMKKLTTARALYEKALELIPKKFQIEFEVAKGACLLNLTKSYQDNETDRAKIRDRAQEAIFSLFEQSKLLYETGKYTRVDAFKLLIGYLRALRLLALDNIANHQAIQIKINACKNEIPEEQSGAPASDPHQRVTAGSPDRSRRLGRLFIAAVCIAAFAVATVALYQRCSVKSLLSN